jgi:hypothetical protein
MRLRWDGLLVGELNRIRGEGRMFRAVKREKGGWDSRVGCGVYAWQRGATREPKAKS